jgi:hypothetical protein
MRSRHILIPTPLCQPLDLPQGQISVPNIGHVTPLSRTRTPAHPASRETLPPDPFGDPPTDHQETGAASSRTENSAAPTHRAPSKANGDQTVYTIPQDAPSCVRKPLTLTIRPGPRTITMRTSDYKTPRDSLTEPVRYYVRASFLRFLPNIQYWRQFKYTQYLLSLSRLFLGIL